MPVFAVTIPFAGSFTVNIEADDAKSAKSAAMDEDISLTVEGGKGVELVDWEWEAHERIVQGNVLYARTNEVRVEMIDDGED